MKRLILTLVALAAVLPAWTQGLSGEDRALLESLSRKSASITSFTCQFRQVREVAILSEPAVSTGEMVYRNDGQVMWRYAEPERYQMAFTGKDIRISGDKGTRVLSYSDNPSLSQLRDILLGIMRGDQLADSGRFEMAVSRSDKVIRVRMVPLKRQLKRFFTELELTFTPEDLLVSSFMMKDKDGGTTTLHFTDRIVEP